MRSIIFDLDLTLVDTTPLEQARHERNWQLAGTLSGGEQQMLAIARALMSKPDLIMMDGGKGQVNVALEVLKDLDLQIPVCGMVKDDHHRTRGLYYNNEEIPIDKHSEGFKLITRLQDEAHRFAITYHKSLRGKAQVKSFLDDIPGIGPARRKALMREFFSAHELKEADVERLLQIPEMDRPSAENVYAFLHKKES